MQLHLLSVLSEALKTYNQASAKVAKKICNFFGPLGRTIEIDVGQYPTDMTLPQLRTMLRNLLNKVHPFLPELGPPDRFTFWVVDNYPVVADQDSLDHALRICENRLRNEEIGDDYDRFVIQQFKSQVEQVRGWLVKTGQQFKPVLNEIESSVIYALKDATMTGQEIADCLGRACNSNFKETLSSMIARGLLVNRRPGYQNAYWDFFSKSPQSQD